MKDNNRPIGIFDSGVGGLTVAKSVMEALPNENIIYLGDTARVPYGTRGRETITRFALEMVRFLLSKNVKALVVACNTISSNSLAEIQSISPVPIIDVISPAVEGAVRQTKNKKIAVIGTGATVNSGVYEREIKSADPKITVYSRACPLFVPLVESGMADHPAARLIAQTYLSPVKASGSDTMILGCTHFPLMKTSISEVVGNEVALLDSGKLTAERLKDVLSGENLLRNGGPRYAIFYFTDDPKKAQEAAGDFFGGKLPGESFQVSL